jgi:predicted DNA-binding transcriptional regulator AlpA
MSEEMKLADPLLKTAIVAAMLVLSPETLTEWRTRRNHPLKFIKLGHSVRYRLSDVEAFINSRSRPAAASPVARPRRSLKREASKAEPRS